MKNIFIFFIVLIFCGCSNDIGVNFEKGAFDDVLVFAKNSEKMVMVDFWSDG